LDNPQDSIPSLPTTYPAPLAGYPAFLQGGVGPLLLWITPSPQLCFHIAQRKSMASWRHSRSRWKDVFSEVFSLWNWEIPNSWRLFDWVLYDVLFTSTNAQ